MFLLQIKCRSTEAYAPRYTRCSIRDGIEGRNKLRQNNIDVSAPAVYAYEACSTFTMHSVPILEIGKPY